MKGKLVATMSEAIADEKGRVLVNKMSDRAIAEETLLLLRAFTDIFEGIARNPMLAAMIPGLPRL